MGTKEPGSRLKYSLAENTAHLRVLADRYTYVVARATRGIDEEMKKPVPSQWKIQSWKNVREKAENALVKFKAGPERLPDWMGR